MNRLKKYSLVALIAAMGMYGANKVFISLKILKAHNYQFLDAKILDTLNAGEVDVNFSKGTPLDTYCYLSFANYLVANHFKMSQHVDASNLLGRIKDRRANCAVMSDVTLSTYINLIKKSGDMNYLDSVRLVSGYTIDSVGLVGHRWVEYKLIDKWLPFETTMWVDKPENLHIQDLEARLKIDLAVDKSRYIPYVYTYVSKELQPKKKLNWINVIRDPHPSHFYNANKHIL